MDGQHDGLKAQALLEHLLHVLTVVLVLLDALAVGVYVGVARDAYHGAVLRRVRAEAGIEAGKDDVFEQDVAHAPVDVGDLDHAGQRRGHFDDAEQAPFVIGCGGEGTGHVERPVSQIGEGVTRITARSCGAYVPKQESRQARMTSSSRM